MKHTDKDLLLSGIKKMALALPLLFLSPYLLTLSFINKENFMFYLGLTLGILVGAAAIYLCFKGINTIIKSMFG
jgi:succinate-acetate transporter protein